MKHHRSPPRCAAAGRVPGRALLFTGCHGSREQTAFTVPDSL